MTKLRLEFCKNCKKDTWWRVGRRKTGRGKAPMKTIHFCTCCFRPRDYPVKKKVKK